MGYRCDSSGGAKTERSAQATEAKVGFSPKSRWRLPNAHKTLEFLTKEVQQLERDILIEAATATGNLSMLDMHFKWLGNGFDTFPPIELFFAVDVGN